jgi:hypothetical protein
MSDLTPCAALNGEPCELYFPGHVTHWIHAKNVGRTPWGWRDAVVSSVDGGWITVSYLESGRQVRLWHHAELAGEVGAGAPVRLHEQYYVLGGPFGWLNVVVRGGLGPVPAPADPAGWERQMTGGVQDLSTGRALALDWVDPHGG